MLKTITGAFDLLFDRPFPYMMVIHQTPVNTEEYWESDKYFHFHIEFYPPLRDKDKIKWYASSEMGAWVAANPLSVEETAPKLREAIERFLKNEPE
jgi:UDPglucose--hexose-1-phosphate uridylyltransferase